MFFIPIFTYQHHTYLKIGLKLFYILEVFENFMKSNFFNAQALMVEWFIKLSASLVFLLSFSNTSLAFVSTFIKFWVDL